MKMTIETVRTRTGTFDVEGYRIPSPKDFEFLSLFVHRSIGMMADHVEQIEHGTWNVSDLHTGHRAAPGYKTQKYAIQAVHDVLKLKGLDVVKVSFDRVIEIYGDLLTDKGETDGNDT